MKRKSANGKIKPPPEDDPMCSDSEAKYIIVMSWFLQSVDQFILRTFYFFPILLGISRMRWKLLILKRETML